ncbi:MAG: glycine cleavage system protein H, partial [Candidatus Latescibacteria bacterium]|nr:glycine cleavage system protein H [Candidatus Latescibacterota bacterium]
IEAIKAFSDLISPVSGTVTAVNTELLDHPEWVNEDPYGHGWMIEIRMSNLAEIDTLLSSQYEGEIGEA